jgi:hypothetical protein
MAETVVLTDGEDKPRLERPVRKPKPTTALLHSDEPTLPFQQKAIKEFLAAEAAKRATGCQIVIDPVQANQTKTSSSSRATSCETTPVVVPAAHVPSTSRILDTIKRAHVEEIANEESGDEERENARINPKCESANLPRVV